MYFRISRMRNVTLDYFKLCLSFLVVSIHLSPLFVNKYRLFGDVISDGIAQIAVPLFFMISGFYLQDKVRIFGKIKKQISRFLIVYIVWTLIYIPFWINVGYGKFVSIIFLILGYAHLWYLPAIIISILMIYTLIRFNIKFRILIPSLFFLYFLGFYVEYYLNSEVTTLSGPVLLMNLTRGILTTGLPFVFLGYYIRSFLYDKLVSISNHILFSISSICILFILLKVYLSHIGWEISVPSVLFILSSFSIITLCTSLFILVNKYSIFSTSEKSGFIGELSSGIYYSHVMCIFIANMLVDSMNIYKFPLIIFLSMLISTMLIILNPRLKIFL